MTYGEIDWFLQRHCLDSREIAGIVVIIASAIAPSGPALHAASMATLELWIIQSGGLAEIAARRAKASSG